MKGVYIVYLIEDNGIFWIFKEYKNAKDFQKELGEDGRGTELEYQEFID